MKKYISEIIKHPLFSGSMIMIIGSNFANFLNLLYHFVIGKMLGPGGYGELVAIITLIGLFGIIPASLSLVVMKYISASKSDVEISTLINWFKTQALKISLIFSVIIFITSPLVSSFLHINKVIYLILVAFSFLFSTQSLLNRAILQGLLKFKEMVLSMVAENGFKLLISVLLIYLGLQVGGAIGGFVVSILIGWYITNYYLRYHRKQKKLNVNLRQMLAFAVPVSIQSLAITSLYSSDVILVKHFFSSSDAGIYSALSTLGKIIFLGAGPIGAVMFPLISQRHAKGTEYRKVFIYSLLATLILATFVLLVYWLLPEVVINLLYGTAYLKAANLLIWFGIFITLFTLSSLLITFHLSLGRTKVVWLPVAASIAQIIAIWFYHGSLLTVVVSSITVTALLLGLLLIYSSYEKGKSRNKFAISHSAGL